MMTKKPGQFTRREFIKRNTWTGVGALILGPHVLMACNRSETVGDESGLGNNPQNGEPVIDIHQHTNYHSRNDEHTLQHQREMGITTTILLPAGRPVDRASTHYGASNGLGGVQAGGNEDCYRFAQEHPDEYLFAACEVPDLPDAVEELETWLDRGAKMIGELKFGVEVDSPEMQKIYEVAEEYDVPVLLHFQHGRYNMGFERFHTMLEKYPRVNFIGHAQTWWANIDKGHEDQSNLYPSGDLTPGGITDRLLSDYPNIYGDLSAGSGLNALTRDEDFTREFFDRHQDKLLYGSDCADETGFFDDCQGARTLDVVQRLSPNKEVERKLLYENSKELFKL